MIFSIYEDRQGTLWTGNDVGLGRFDPESATYHLFEPRRQSPGFTPFSRTGEADSGSAQISCLTCELECLLRQADGRRDQPGCFRGPSRKHLVYSTRGWQGGIRKLDTSGILTRFSSRKASTPSEPPRVQVNFIHEDSEGTLWLATETGLLQFDPKTERYVDYTTQEGLPDNIVQCILPDDAGNLWISTSKGISRFNPKDKTFFNYV